MGGQSYKGQWARGKKHGQARHYKCFGSQCVYFLCVLLQGTQTYLRSGELGDANRLFIGGVGSLYRMSSFTGTWDNGVRSGIGVMTYTCGDTLEGHFRQGQPHGVMVYRFASTGRTRLARYDQGSRLEWIVIKKAPSPAKKKANILSVD